MFDSTPGEDFLEPFSAELHTSMKERKEAAVVLSNLTEADYNTPLHRTSRPVTDNLLLGLNLLRTARMDTRGKLLTKDESKESEAKDALRQRLPNESSCSVPVDAPTGLEGLFLVVDKEQEPRENPQFTALLQKELNAALDKLSEIKPAYDPETKYDKEQSPFNTRTTQNAAYLMFPAATGAGCAVTDECTDGKSYILCTFSPTLEDKTSVPFPADLYKSMLDRKTANVDLSTLTEDDYNTPLDHTSGAGHGADFSAGLLAFIVMRVLAF
ncbi:hypothetical protein ACSSS7_007098 [Eimeria intestinalis]